MKRTKLTNTFLEIYKEDICSIGDDAYKVRQGIACDVSTFAEPNIRLSAVDSEVVITMNSMPPEERHATAKKQIDAYLEKNNNNGPHSDADVNLTDKLKMAFPNQISMKNNEKTITLRVKEAWILDFVTIKQPCTFHAVNGVLVLLISVD
jgi:hypothetical protein